jgi:integrase
VPLSRQAAYVLRELRKLTGNGPFIFPSVSAEGYMGETTWLSALDQIGCSGHAIGHGFRAIASAVFHKHGFADGLVDGQLRHLSGNAGRDVHNSTESLAQRQHLMQWWADHLDSLLVESDEIAPLPLAS